MAPTRLDKFNQLASQMGYSFDGEIRIGGNYVSTVEHRGEIYVSGQIPRVGDTIVALGRAGADATLAQAQLGARVGAMRALALLKQALGSLDRVGKILRITVYVQSAPDFTRQSEVADAASEVLYTVLGDAGKHTRTSIGVYQLPKNATTEVDLIATFD